MPDLPDDYPFNPGSTRYPLVDMAELAARVNAFDVYDRRGQVIWWDRGLGGTAPWIVSPVIGSNKLSLINEYTYFGPYALQLTSDLTTSAFVFMYHILAAAELNKWGAEVAFGFPGNFERLSIRFMSQDGTNAHAARIDFLRSGDKVQITDENGNLLDVGTLPLLAGNAGVYHHVKMVADFADDMYVRLLIDNQEIDLSAYPLYVYANASGPWQYFQIVLWAEAASVQSVNLGNVILTVNEP